ncbi:MAG: hypothetical protein AAGH46_02130 [Bacteroidota bacterium]
MTQRFKVLILSLAFAFLNNCERDDICSEGTPTTPRLIIEFYDASEEENLKNVPNFTVFGEDPGLAAPDNEDNSTAIRLEPFENERLFNSISNIAKLPLLTGNEGEETTLRFNLERRTDLRLDEDEMTSSNIDMIEIEYVTRYEYVSRACGYKSVFTNLRITVVPDEDNWLALFFTFPDNDNTDNITVENEDSTHINLFH